MSLVSDGIISNNLITFINIILPNRLLLEFSTLNIIGITGRLLNYLAKKAFLEKKCTFILPHNPIFITNLQTAPSEAASFRV